MSPGTRLCLNRPADMRYSCESAVDGTVEVESEGVVSPSSRCPAYVRGCGHLDRVVC